MIDYYCDHNVCMFNRDDWCSYWDSFIELMKNRGIKCNFNNSTYYQIDEIMDDCFEIEES